MWKYHSHTAQYLKHLFPYYCLSITPTAPSLCTSLPAVGLLIPNTGCAYIALRDLPPPLPSASGDPCKHCPVVLEDFDLKTQPKVYMDHILYLTDCGN